MTKRIKSDNILKVENLCMYFGGIRAVDGISFEIKKGEIFGLIGPNGAGKTTVFNCITQFYKPTSGKVRLFDKNGESVDLTEVKVHDVSTYGVVRTFQNVEVVPELTVVDNLLLAAHRQYRSGFLTQMLHLKGLEKEEREMRKKAEEVLEFMGISMYKDWYAAALPYGILKKVEIARTLMGNPRLIILDEPAAGLNGKETEELAALIGRIRDVYGCAVFLVEHDMGLVMNICDRILAISFGKFLAVGSAEEIQSNRDVRRAYLGESS
ncbi:MAG: ABC transporter ATP-binding protein [Bacillota bacterium]|nr:ABC transporter ATP-binding protein [Bacillota bacterium]